MSQPINDFSDYDILQSVDWECPSLSPHVLLIIRIILVLLSNIYFASSKEKPYIYDECIQQDSFVEISNLLGHKQTHIQMLQVR